MDYGFISPKRHDLRSDSAGTKRFRAVLLHRQANAYLWDLLENSADLKPAKIEPLYLLIASDNIVFILPSASATRYTQPDFSLSCIPLAYQIRGHLTAHQIPLFHKKLFGLLSPLIQTGMDHGTQCLSLLLKPIQLFKSLDPLLSCLADKIKACFQPAQLLIDRNRERRGSLQGLPFAKSTPRHCNCPQETHTF